MAEGGSTSHREDILEGGKELLISGRRRSKSGAMSWRRKKKVIGLWNVIFKLLFLFGVNHRLHFGSTVSYCDFFDPNVPRPSFRPMRFPVSTHATLLQRQCFRNKFTSTPFPHLLNLR